MATGMSAFGGFAEGLTEGYKSGTALRLAQQKEERDQKAFDLEQQVKQTQLDEVNRRKAMNEQISLGMQELEDRIKGGVIGGEAEDEFGQSVGKVEYASPAEAKKSGLKFKEGTTVEKKGEQLTQTQIDRLRANVFQKARIDNKFFDEESFIKQRQLNKEIEKEGVFEAFKYFDQTGDSEKAVELYNSSGGRSLPKGSFIQKELDPDTGFATNVVYAPGPDGKPQRITSSFELQMLYMPEEYIKYGMTMGKEKFVQGQENKRLGYSEAGKDRRTAMEVGAKGNKDKEPGWIIDLQKTTIANIKDDPTKRLRAGEYEMAINEAGALARKLAAEKNLDANTAWSIATQEAYSRRGLVAPTVKTPKQ